MRPIPTKLKIIRGNPGKRALNKEEPEPKPGIPEMPDYLNAFPIAVKEWEIESKILDDMGVLTEADRGALATRCLLASEIQILITEIEAEGRTIDCAHIDSKGRVTETTKPNPKYVQFKTILSEYRQLGSLLGLDPSSRTRIKIEGKKSPSKVESFKRKKKA